MKITIPKYEVQSSQPCTSKEIRMIITHIQTHYITANKSVRKEGGNDFFDAQKVGLKSCTFQTLNYWN